jgi:magnesium transporter
VGPAVTTRVLLLEDGRVRLDATLADAAAALGRPRTLVWIDCDCRSDEVHRFAEQTLKLHPLTLEDLWETRESPKVEQFDEYLYVVAHGARLTGARNGARNGTRHEARSVDGAGERSGGDGNGGGGRKGRGVPVAEEVEIDLVLGAGWLLTHHPSLPFVDEVRAEMARHVETLARGGHVLLHALLDRLVDLYAPVLDAFDRSIEQLEDVALRARPPRSALRRLLDLRRALHRLRRSAVHQREVLLRLARGDFSRIPREAQPFFRDIFDHFARVADLFDDDREMLANVFEAWMSTHSNRMNEIMKVLTLISTIMLPLTFIAGVYGMNFERMPELKWDLGYPAVLGVMAVTAGALLLWFRRRGWFE